MMVECVGCGRDVSTHDEKCDVCGTKTYADGVGDCPTCGPASPMVEIITNQNGDAVSVCCCSCFERFDVAR